MRLTIGHSPDPDDAFMIYAIAKGLIDTGFDLELVAEPIGRLNEQARNRSWEVTALSAHAYGHLHEGYRLLPVGSSVGRDYGPVVVAEEAVEVPQLAEARIGVPGAWTTAYLVSRMALPEFQPIEVPFDEVPDALEEGAIDAGVLVHEGQISYERHGLVEVLDLGRWWREETGLPLPLGLNAVTRSLPDSVQSGAGRVFRESVQYALDHRESALDYAMAHGPGLSREQVDRYVKMYVNEDTLDLRDDVLEALEVLYERAAEDGALEGPVEIDPVAVTA